MSMRQTRREALRQGIGLGLLTMVGENAAEALAFGDEPTGFSVQPYADPAQWTPIAKGAKQSFYLQPWRSYLETVPATQFLSGLGVNYNLPRDADHDAVVRVLSDCGIRSARVEVGWASVPWSEDRLNNADNIHAILAAMKKYGVVPLMLLNAHHGYPCPAKGVSRIVVAGGDKGARTLTLDNVADLTPGRSGLSSLFHAPMAGFIFTRIDPATKIVQLSRPLPEAIADGTKVTLHTLKYAPFYPVGTPEFEETATGWLRYAGLVLDAVAASGITAFDVEIWNEMSFGSDFTQINNYYQPHLIEKQTDFLHPGGSNWEVARRTIELVKSRAPGAKVIWGFSNTSFYHCPIAQLPPGTDGQSYHPYGTGREVTPKNFPEKDRTSWFIEGYVPQGLVKCMPEGWAHLGIKIENLIHHLQPDIRKSARPPGVQSFAHCMTEHGVDPPESGIVETAAALEYKAKSTIRETLFWLNKGISKMDIFCAYDLADPKKGAQPDTGFGLLREQPHPRDYAAHAPDTLRSPALRALRNVVGQMDGAQMLTAVRALDVDVVALGEQTKAFEGDGVHPPLWNREMFAFLPYQVSADKFVCAVYLMCCDITNSPPPMDFLLTVKNVAGRAARVHLYDPIADAEAPFKLTRRAERELTVRFAANEYPRLLVLDRA